MDKINIINKNLENNYIDLLKNRIYINNLIKEDETLNSAYINSNLNATSNYYNYILYSIIASFLIILFFKFSLTYTQNGGGNKMNNIFIKSHNNLNNFLFITIILLSVFLIFK